MVRAPLAGFILLAAVAAAVITACRAGPSEGGAPAPMSSVSLASSYAKWSAVRAYGVNYTVRPAGASGGIRGEGAYQSQTAVYARATISGGPAAATDMVTSLFLPPDLYVQQGDGTWFVQSPWNQGFRPDQSLPGDPNRPLVDYAEFLGGLQGVQDRPDETVGGKTLARFHGEIDLASLSELAAEGATGTAQAEVWIDPDTALPATLEIRIRGSSGFDLVMNFVDFDKPVTPPAAPTDARPLRDAEYPDAPCTADKLAGCLAARTEITGADSCPGTGRRVCLVPLGMIPPDLVDYLVSYYRDRFGLRVTVLRPIAIPAALEDPKRLQIDADGLITYMGTQFPEAYRDSQVVLIGLTPIDVYDNTSHFRYLLGLRRNIYDPKAVVSSARMDPVFFGEPNDIDVYFARTRKLFSKYLGLLYYGLPTSDDPKSPMYDYIRGPGDVDAMGDLTVPGGQ